ncbi:Fur-regulated basic protein FbpA [Bacillus sp. AFS055030]|uniref:Fur-regulated basic protein FbpA n=1 Tax=Bacillus sp. AFS055030 TaxID=2033507 RepID=UPI000BFE005E|nr:Fur-regulated basic protein FbpA [Bacillus sp. AFS055030]PGL73125.1 Fur-regulated basic protein FbpA [Bacillus sp. AFS055030]
MENMLRKAVETRKQYLINKLIKVGVYKKESSHLFVLTLTELEDEFNRVISMKKSKKLS